MPPTHPAFTAADLRLLGAIRQHDQGLRMLLCTLARRGAAFRQGWPERAQAWLDELAPHPFYKGAQFLFDLLEWEDFMVDGEPPPVMGEAALAASLDRVATVLRAVGAELGAGLGSTPASDIPPDLAEVFSSTDELPALEPGFYLYQDVALGAVGLFLAQPEG